MSPSCQALACALVSGLVAHAAQAQSWPAKPIRMIVASAPGGILDTVGRTIAARL